MTIRAVKDELTIKFGCQPVANRFLKTAQEKSPAYFMNLSFSQDTSLIKLNDPFPLDEIKPRFDWLTCYEPEDHLDEFVEELIHLPGISKNSVFAGYSFKDSSLLQRLERLGYSKSWILDPADDLEVVDTCASIETYQSKMSIKRSDLISKRRGKADVFIARHVLEHAYNLDIFLEAVKKLVHEDGYLIFEVPDCRKPLELGDPTMAWEEHLYYFTSLTFRQLLMRNGLSFVSYKVINYPLEDCLLAIVKISNAQLTCLPDSLEYEIELERFKRYANLIKDRKKSIQKLMMLIATKFGKVAIFGAGHASVAFLSYMGISHLVKYVVDDNPNKNALVMPIGGIQIVGSEILNNDTLRVCLLALNPQNQQKVIEKNSRFMERRGIFSSIFPVSNNYIEALEWENID